MHIYKQSTILRMTTRINIGVYTTKFTAYPSDLLEFCSGGVKLPKLDALRGQAIALLAQPENRGLRFMTREDTALFFTQIGIQTDDSIQPFNKDFGLKKMSGKGKYCLEYPFVMNTTHIQKRAGAKLSGDRDDQINTVKDWWRANLVDVSNAEWQLGHLDPTIPDATEANLAFQPPLQARYRDRFKWDDIFHIMWPTAEKELIPNIDKYYTEEEQRLIFEKLREKFA
jgi:hypothetical protein